MKKLFAILFCFVMFFSACVSESPVENTEPSFTEKETALQENQEEPSENDYYYEYADLGVTTWTDSIGTCWAQVAVEIYNAGKYDLFLNSSSVDLETASGSLFATQNYIGPCPQVISPGEYAYYIETIMLDSAPEEELFTNWHLDICGSVTEKILFPVTDIKFSTDKYTDLKVIGRVENTTSKEQTLIEVCIIALDENNSVLTKLSTYVDIAPNDKVGFECYGLAMPDGITADDVAAYIVYAFPHQYQF